MKPPLQSFHLFPKKLHATARLCNAACLMLLLSFIPRKTGTGKSLAARISADPGEIVRGSQPSHPRCAAWDWKASPSLGSRKALATLQLRFDN